MKGNWLPRLAVAFVGIPSIYFTLRHSALAFGLLLLVVALGATLEYSRMRGRIFPAQRERTRALDLTMNGVLYAACVAAVLSQLVEENESYKSARLWYLVMRVLHFIVTPLCTLILPLVGKGTADPARGAAEELGAVVPYITRMLCDWGFLSVLTSALLGFMRIRRSVDPYGNDVGISKTVFVIMTPWVGDAGALLLGGKLGSLHVIPRLSPNKTLEGFLGLFLFAQISTFGMRYVGYLLYPHHRFNLFHRTANPLFLFFVSLISAAAAAVGDLIESTIKRLAGVKDTSHLFGPHGGVLDKVDSIMLTTACLSHLIA